VKLYALLLTRVLLTPVDSGVILSSPSTWAPRKCLITCTSISSKQSVNLKYDSVGYKQCTSGLRSQKDLVLRRGMILEGYHIGQDQSYCLALWMRARNLIYRGEPLQVLFSLIYHLVWFGVLVDSLEVR